MASISEQLMHSTIRIECRDAFGRRSSGSGFFFHFFEHQGACIPAIVTNRHVVAGARRGRLHFTVKGEDGTPRFGQHVSVDIQDFEDCWIDHPDPEVDMAVFLVGDLLNECVDSGKPVFYLGIGRELVAHRSVAATLTPIEEIIMIGYPNGIWDATNNLPVVRRGITASPAFVDYDGKQEFLIDAACFPGSSGSPVFLLNLGTYPDREGKPVIGNRVALLGVLYAGPQQTTAGEIVVATIPTDMRAMPISRIPTNLGLCIKAHRLLEFERLLAERGVPVPEGYGMAVAMG